MNGRLTRTGSPQSVFGMGHDIVEEQAGWPNFGWLLAVFLVATIVFALCLRLIIEQVRKLQKFVRGIVQVRRPTVQLTSERTQSAVFGKLLHHLANEAEEGTLDLESGSYRS